MHCLISTNAIWKNISDFTFLNYICNFLSIDSMVFCSCFEFWEL